MEMRDFRGVRATVLGLGGFGGGVAATRFLATRGARVTVTDMKLKSDLSSSLQQLEGLPIERLVLGSNPVDVLDECQLLVVNPAVNPSHPTLVKARSLGLQITTEIDLFLQHQRGDRKSTRLNSSH